MAEGGVKENVIESYVVSVGFKTDDTAGQDFINTQKEIEQRNKEIDQQNTDTGKSFSKQAKSSAENAKSAAAEQVKANKQKSVSNAEYEKTLRQLGRTWREISSGNPIGAAVESFKSIQLIKELVNSLTHLKTAGVKQPPAAKETPKSTAKAAALENAPVQTETAREQKTVWVKPKVQPVSQPPAEQPVSQAPAETKSNVAQAPLKKEYDRNNLGKNVTTVSKSLTEANKQASTFQKVLQSIFTSSSAASAEISAEAISSGLAAATGIGLIATATVSATKIVVDMTNSLSEANTDIETMSAKMWISNDAAWELNNTLSAMGKTTSDLNDIALNPTLRKQFQELQEYQKSALQLPSDFKSVNEEWAESVTLPMEKVKLTNTYMKELISYDFEKALIVPASRIANLLLAVSDSIKDIIEAFDNLGKEITGSAWYKGLTTLFNNIKESTSEYGAAALGKKASAALSGQSENSASDSTDTATSSSSNSSSTETSAAEKALQNYNYSWQTIVPTSTAYNSSSASTTNNNGASVKYENTQQFNIYPSSSDSATVAQQTADATSKANESSILVLTHSLKGSG
jgi:hypothetical protein